MAKKYESAAEEYAEGAGETRAGARQRVKANRQTHGETAVGRRQRVKANRQVSAAPKGEVYTPPPAKSNDRPWEKSKARSRARRNRRC